MKGTWEKWGMKGALLASVLAAACAHEGVESRSDYTGSEGRTLASDTAPALAPATVSAKEARPQAGAPAPESDVSAPTSRIDLVAGGGQSDPATAGTPSSGPEQTSEDAVLTGKVRNTLANDRDEDVRVLLVGVSNGTVTLGGTVKSEEQRERASETVQNVDGVESVVNRVTLAQAN